MSSEVQPTHWQLISNILMEAGISFSTPLDHRAIEVPSAEARMWFDRNGRLVKFESYRVRR